MYVDKKRHEHIIKHHELHSPLSPSVPSFPPCPSIFHSSYLVLKVAGVPAQLPDLLTLKLPAEYLQPIDAGGRGACRRGAWHGDMVGLGRLLEVVGCSSNEGLGKASLALQGPRTRAYDLGKGIRK